jgi:lipoprotein-anchoring transpeptidase ErfK/SrfK
VLFWIVGAMALLLAGLIVLLVETPRIKAYMAGKEPPNSDDNPALYHEEPLPQSAPAAPVPPLDAEARREAIEEKKLAEQVRVETQQEVDRPAPAMPTPAPRPAIESNVVSPPKPPPPRPPEPVIATPAEPPVAQPAVDRIGSAPVRALPLDPNKLDTERIAAYQVALERIHFSCGFVDGDQGMRTQRMLRAFQTSRGLPVTGFLDPATRAAIGEPGEPFQNYTVTADDVASIMPKPPTWRAKAAAKRLGYNDIWELLAEKFHCTRGYLRALNPGVVTPVAGTEMIGPKVFPAAPIPKAASLRILLGQTSIEALDAQGRIIAFFPCSIAADKNKRPHGLLTVKVVDPNPDYTFDPALFADAAKAEGITHKMVLPPGPRNPVGTTWVGLSLPGYGIHGTPEPENISRTQSHGCFRLANWNAQKVLKMVKVGTPVDVEP